MKYDIWTINGYDEEKYQSMLRSGLTPLVAATLCSHGIDTPEKTRQFLSTDILLYDAMLLTDMGKAVDRVRSAISSGERIAVYGDYDVDGITATCLLTDYLKRAGADCTYYIPGRIEEGYGLNTTAIEALKADGVGLIVTVDCGITAVEETEYASSLGIDLVITDHHECKSSLPAAVAVVDPRRGDCEYPFPALAGVGVAFKLACALAGGQNLDRMVDEYCDLVCLGTVADVMPLLGENRSFVRQGIASLQNSKRPGVRQLIKYSNIDANALTVSTVGFSLAPRINAAGRMGKIELATGLFFSKSDSEAEEYAAALCALNRERQEVEAGIYKDAVSELTKNPPGAAIVLANESWHQGVVGIVASRLAEEFRRPTFLICFDGDRGKASSRSFGGFNLFAALESCGDLLTNFGGHELAAGFTIHKAHIDAFRRRMCDLAAQYSQEGDYSQSLRLDCEIADPELLTLTNTADLDMLEPCGSGSPKPLFYMKGLKVDAMTEVGGGRHLKLKLSKSGSSVGAIFFSVNAEKSGVSEDDTVEIAFCPQINEYRGMRSVQLLLTDIRCCDATDQFQAQQSLYHRFENGSMSKSDAASLLPVRDDFVAVWRYLRSHCQQDRLSCDWGCLTRCICRSCNRELNAAKLRVCLDVFAEHKLIKLSINRNTIKITITSNGEKIDLGNSTLLKRLKAVSGI